MKTAVILPVLFAMIKIAVCKEYTIKCHYAVKHKSEYNKRRKMKIDELKKQFSSQQNIFKKILKLIHVQNLAI